MPYPRIKPTTVQFRPMWEMNTTPLIDVLLVLLIMMIITIPLKPHSLEIDLPGEPPEGPALDYRVNRVVVTVDGRTLWNGAQVDEAGLAALLAATRRFKDEPQLQFGPEAQAGYEESAEVIRQIKESGVKRFAFVGNERNRRFGKED